MPSRWALDAFHFSNLASTSASPRCTSSLGFRKTAFLSAFSSSGKLSPTVSLTISSYSRLSRVLPSSWPMMLSN